jgi:hypothetical protein
MCLVVWFHVPGWLTVTMSSEYLCLVGKKLICFICSSIKCPSSVGLLSVTTTTYVTMSSWQETFLPYMQQYSVSPSIYVWCL